MLSQLLKNDQRNQFPYKVITVYLVILHGRKTTRFLESSDSDIKKLVANAVPESTRKSCCQRF